MRVERPDFKPLAYLLPDMYKEVQAITAHLDKMDGRISENGANIKHNGVRIAAHEETVKKTNGDQNEKLDAHRRWLIGLSIAVAIIFILIIVGIVFNGAQWGWF